MRFLQLYFTVIRAISTKTGQARALSSLCQQEVDLELRAGT